METHSCHWWGTFQGGLDDFLDFPRVPAGSTLMSVTCLVLLDTDFDNLRYAFETWLVDKDVPGAVQKALMGHSPGSVTESYAHPSLEKVRECVNRLSRLPHHVCQGGDSK